MSRPRLHRHPRFARWLASVPRAQQYTCTQVVGELWYGAERVLDTARRQELLARIDAALARLTLIVHNRRVAEAYAVLRVHLDRVGRPIREGDLWIAATAAVHRLAVVTANVSHFTELPGVMIEAIHTEADAR